MQCKATSRQGKQCKSLSISGGTVCRMHGGGAPQVKEKAKLRLLALVEPALGALSQLVKDKRSPSVRLGAAKDILDRAGIGEQPEASGNSGQTIQLVVVQAGAPRVDGKTQVLDIMSLVKQ